MKVGQGRKPSEIEVMGLARELQEEARERDALYDRMDGLYDQEVVGGADPGVKRVVMPFSTNTVNLVTDLAAQQEMHIEVPGVRETQEAQKRADETEAWLRAWVKVNEARRNTNFTADMAWHGVQRGVVVVKTIFSDKLVQAGEGGEFGLRSMPVLLLVRDPRQVYWVEDVEGPAVVLEVYKRKASEIRALYPGVLAEDRTGLVEWIEYWDWKWRGYFADGRLVRGQAGGLVAHGYGVLPYVLAPARTTPRRPMGKRFRPLLSGVEDVLWNLDVWFSILATAGWQSVANSWAVFSDGYGREGGKELATGPGDINYFAKLDQVQPLQRAALPPDFFKLGDLFLQAFQQGTFPFAMYGQVGQSLAGYAINLLTQSGRRPILPIWKAIELGYAGAMRNCALICRNKVAPLVGADIALVVPMPGQEGEAGTLRSIKLATKGIGDDFTVTVRLSDPMPQDEASNLRMALEASGGEAPLLSKQTALTKYQVVEDAARELERIEAEKVFRQLAPFEAIKLAIQRGYLPAQLRLPEGFVLGPHGELLPEAAVPQQPEGAGPPGPGGAGPPRPGGALLGPAPQGAPGGLPTGPGQLPPAGAPNATDMQALLGLGPQLPELAQLGGAPPPLPSGGVLG